MTKYPVDNPPTEEEFLAAVDAAVEAAGEDFVCPKVHCTYDGSVRCLYGQALFDLGFPVPDELEEKSINTVLYHMFGWDMFGPVAGAAVYGQEEQDIQKPWGFARSAMWGAYNRMTQ